ncbi:MAG TPA: CpaF family protein [Actinomycetota bacterium]|nr:CpaF family protein [Actinomycetota bacterium]
MQAPTLDARRIKDTVRTRLLAEGVSLERLTAPERRLRVRSEVMELLKEERAILPASAVTDVVNQVSDEVVGLGPIERLLKDPEVSEVMVNGADDVYVERKGRIEKVDDLLFEGEEQVFHLIERIVAPLGLRVDESLPYVDARLSDGSRVHAIIPPLSLCGPALTIRKFTLRPFTPEDLIELGTLTPPMSAFLKACVRAKANIVISGGTGSGKTTLLGVLSSFVPGDERLITIEDAAELRLSQPHVVALEARPPNVEGAGAVTVRALVRNALRMRPDRIIVGEVRGGEALDMLQAMNTGHEGCLSTAHANSPRDALSRLETMALMSDIDLPVFHVREQLASALDLIVHMARLSDGRRIISEISSVEGLRGGAVVLEEVFTWRRSEDRFVPGKKPLVIDRLRERGHPLEPEILRLFGSSTRVGDLAEPARRQHESVVKGEFPPVADPEAPRRRRPRVARLAWRGSLRRLGTVLE